MTTYTGTSGNDSLAGTSSADTFKLQQGGNDTASGLGGDDQFKMGGALNAADRIDGGGGYDTVALNGDYSAGLAFGVATMVNVEKITLAAGYSYNLNINDATVTAGPALTVDGSALGAADRLVFNGADEQDGSLFLIGGAGNDSLSGGTYAAGSSATDTFSLEDGGDDTVLSGPNAFSIVNFGRTFTAADRVRGNSGPGGWTAVVLDGSYTGARAVTMNATTLVSVDALAVSAGHSYTLTSADALLGRGGRTVIDGSKLGAADVLSFDGSAETLGAFDFIGGAGDDVLIAGHGVGQDNLGASFDLTRGGNDRAVGSAETVDTFALGAAFTAQDRVDGRGAADDFAHADTVILDGNYAGALAVTFAAATMVRVEKLDLVAGHSYTLTTSDATIAAGKVLRVDATTLGASDVLTFNGGAESDGTFIVWAGKGNDVLTGGTGADIFGLHEGGRDTLHARGGDDSIGLDNKLTAADAIDGGRGDDSVDLSGDYSAGVTFTSSTLTHVEHLWLEQGHSYKLTTADGTVSDGARLDVEASALSSGNNLDFDGSAETDGSFDVKAGAGDDTIVGGAGDDRVDFGSHFDADDFFNGRAGNDAVFIDKAHASSITLSNLRNVEDLVLKGDSYHITTTDGVVSNGAQLFVSFDGVNGQTLWFDGSAETNGSFGIGGKAGNDHIRGGARSDGIGGGGGADFLRGGGGNDNYFYDTVGDSTSKSFDRIFGFGADHADRLVLSADPITGINAKVAHGSLSNATFDSDLATAVNAAHLLAHHAVLFTPDAGGHAGQTFLVIDANAQAGYQASADYVIRLQSPSNIGQLSTSSFATF